MPEIVQHCCLCGSSQSSPFDQRSFRGQPVANRVCLSCGLVYQSPRGTPEELEHFYAAEYRQMYQGGEGPAPKDLAVQIKRAEGLAQFCRNELQAVKRHLDIGCSAGLLLQAFQKVFGSQPVGIEPGNAYRLYAQAKGLSVYASLDELRAAGEARFDLISMAHVLEHIPGPVEYLVNLRQDLLQETGWLLLEVPNLYAHDCFEVAHLASFSVHTLTQVVQKAGFRVARLACHGYPRSAIIPLYITLLARPSAAIDPSEYRVIPEKNARLKRRLGMLRRRVVTRLFPGRAWLPVPAAPNEIPGPGE